MQYRMVSLMNIQAPILIYSALALSYNFLPLWYRVQWDLHSLLSEKLCSIMLTSLVIQIIISKNQSRMQQLSNLVSGVYLLLKLGLCLFDFNTLSLFWLDITYVALWISCAILDQALKLQFYSNNDIKVKSHLSTVMARLQVSLDDNKSLSELNFFYPFDFDKDTECDTYCHDDQTIDIKSCSMNPIHSNGYHSQVQKIVNWLTQDQIDKFDKFCYESVSSRNQIELSDQEDSYPLMVILLQNGTNLPWSLLKKLTFQGAVICIILIQCSVNAAELNEEMEKMIQSISQRSLDPLQSEDHDLAPQYKLFGNRVNTGAITLISLLDDSSAVLGVCELNRNISAVILLNSTFGLCNNIESLRVPILCVSPRNVDSNCRATMRKVVQNTAGSFYFIVNTSSTELQSNLNFCPQIYKILKPNTVRIQPLMQQLVIEFIKENQEDQSKDSTLQRSCSALSQCSSVTTFTSQTSPQMRQKRMLYKQWLSQNNGMSVYNRQSRRRSSQIERPLLSMANSHQSLINLECFGY
ncbi:hypothetical protein MIR68_003447 [Amoeboaphelidium protococcarum]|nr:hypothetical protein MIR68_003447 [Amoeboaphelidium protococcarum]